MKALFFDMDGTLINSEPLHEQAWFDTLAQFDLPLSKDWFHQWTGSTDYYLLEGIQNQFGVALDFQALFEEKRNRFLTIAKNSPLAFEGVVQGLQYLNQSLPIILVTSSTKIGAENVLKWANIRQYFKHIITFDDVINPKPKPEPYLMAAKYVGFNPSECVAFEDSIAGITAAKAAGCFTVAVANSLSKEKLAVADLVVDNSFEMMEWASGKIDNIV